MLKQERNFVEDGAQEWVLALVLHLGVEDPYPAHELTHVECRNSSRGVNANRESSQSILVG